MVDVNKLKVELGTDSEIAEAQKWADEQVTRDKEAKLAFLRKVSPLLAAIVTQAFDSGMEHAIKAMITKLEGAASGANVG